MHIYNFVFVHAYYIYVIIYLALDIVLIKGFLMNKVMISIKIMMMKIKM